jgi:CheY-like chemotaxis protein
VPQQSPIPFPMATKNVLIIDPNEAMQNLRASALRSHGVHVHLAKSVTEAELLWAPDFFDLVLLDLRQRSKEAVAFWRTIRRQHPRQRISFLLGPPTANLDADNHKTPDSDAASVLMESSTEPMAFSSAAIDAPRFAVPAGYKQVEPEIERRSH